MSPLQLAAFIVGGVGIVLGLACVAVPSQARTVLQRLPRHKVAGWVLTAMAVAWAAYLLHGATFVAGLPKLRRLIVVLAPVAYLLIVVFMDELLAARAVGALLLLAPRLVLDAAFAHDQSQWRFVLTVLAYSWVIIGAILVLSPFRFRKAADSIAGTDMRLRVIGGLAGALGVLIVCLGVLVY